MIDSFLYSLVALGFPVGFIVVMIALAYMDLSERERAKKDALDYAMENTGDEI